MKNILQLGVFLLLTSCTMKPQEPTVDRSKFPELQKHRGSKNYEILELFDAKFEVTQPELDSETEQLVVYGKTNPVREKDFLSNRVKISILGDIMDNGITNAELKRDGSLHGFDFYSNWVISGDTATYKYIDPFSNSKIDDPYEFEAKEDDPEKWLAKFKDIYSRAQYIYVDMSFYYFKIENKWFLMEAELEGLPDNLEQKYPPKKDQDVRMIELQDLAPEFYHEGHPKRDTSLIKMVAYESAYFEKVDEGLNQYNFSAGWWYLEIPMPLGDTIRIKRYSNYEDPELLIYKVPGAYGGREDVLFIIQKPEELFPDQVGGMYVIRPRDPEQPQRRYKSISYGDTSKGQPHILRAEETEEYKQWKAGHTE